MRLSQVAFSYPGKPLFRDFSLSVDPGERVALMGPSGRGKSTLLRLMAGLEKPEAGIVAGIPPEGVSMVFQENRLIPGMTLLENLTLAAPGRSRGELLGFLAALGLEGEWNCLPGALSGGMARRVAIARAAALGSSLAILDEPFTGLDQENRRRAAEFLLDHFPQGAIIAAVQLSERYITDRFLPDKAIDLVDEAASKL